jgi:hypothetical protein
MILLSSASQITAVTGICTMPGQEKHIILKWEASSFLSSRLYLN